MFNFSSILSFYFDKILDNFTRKWYTSNINMSTLPLQNLGLTQNEAKIYELLLKLGETPVSTLIRETKLKRATVYTALNTLQGKKLIQLNDIKKKLHAKPESPATLLDMIEQQKTEITNTQANLQSLMPFFSTMYMNSTEKPVVKIHEGLEGLKEIYLDTLRENKTIYALARIEAIDTELHDWLQNYYVKQRAKNKVHAKVILASDKLTKWFTSKDVSEFRTTITVPGEQFPFEHEINIYGDKIAFITNNKGAALIGVTITHPLIAKTAKAWFDLAWIGALQFQTK
jgi:HTH-type transcriptional regulator, sugar sensing transcriptional regulator